MIFSEQNGTMDVLIGVRIAGTKCLDGSRFTNAFIDDYRELLIFRRGDIFLKVEMRGLVGN